MAGNHLQSLAYQFGASASRFKDNMNSVLEKYNRHFEDDDLISLASLSVSRLSSRGTLRKIKTSHPFGSSHLKSTKRKDEILRARLGLNENKVDLNVSRAIQRESAVTISDLDGITANEPSDAETLSSFDEDDIDDDQNNILDGDNAPTADTDKENSFHNSKHDDEEGLSDFDGDVQNHESLFADEQNSESFESSIDSSNSSAKSTSQKDCNSNVVKNSTVTLVISSESEDDCRDDVYGGLNTKCNKIKDEVLRFSLNSSVNRTYVVPFNKQSPCQHNKGGGRNDTRVETKRLQNITAVDSTSRPKVNNELTFSERLLKTSPYNCINHTESSKAKTDCASTSTPKQSDSKQIIKENSRYRSDEGDIRYDSVFKSPQGLNIRRITPVLIRPTSRQSPVGHSPKHSSHTSGVSSCSSLGQGETSSNLNPENLQQRANHQLGLMVSNDFKKPKVPSRFYRNKFLKTQQPPPPPSSSSSASSFRSDNTLDIKTRRVDQWVGMMNNDTTMFRDHLHYSSCPPEMFKQISQQTQTESYLIQKAETHLSSIDKQKDIGIQTTLNDSLRCTKRSSPPRPVMRDVSTILSNSFVDAHSPRHTPDRVSENALLDFEQSQVVFRDENIMFPEEFIYRFCPQNPNRIDSDYSHDRYQNERLRQSLKCFRPRRNEKRALDEEYQNDMSFQPRHSKSMKLDNSFESSYSMRSRDCLLTVLDSSSHGNGDGTYVVDVATNSCRATPCHHKCQSVRKSSIKRQTPSNADDVTRARKSLNTHRRRISGASFVRAGNPQHLSDYNCEERGSCDIIGSSFSNAGIGKSPDNKESRLSPKISSFLDSSRPINNNNVHVQLRGDHDQILLDKSSSCSSRPIYNNGIHMLPKKDHNQSLLDKSSCNTCFRSHPNTPLSYLSPVEPNYPSPSKLHRVGKSSQIIGDNTDMRMGNDVNNTLRTSLFNSKQPCSGSGYTQLRNTSGVIINDINKFAPTRKSDKMNNNSPPLLDHTRLEMKSFGSESFVDAHTPKKVPQLSPRKVLSHNSSHNSTLPIVNQTISIIDTNCPTRSTPNSVRQKRSVDQETSFERNENRCLNSTPSRSGYVVYNTCGSLRKVASHFPSRDEGNRINHPQNSPLVDKGQSYNRVIDHNTSTQEHSFNLPLRSDVCHSKNKPDIFSNPSTKRNTFNDSQSTIHSSDDEEFRKEHELDVSLDNVSAISPEQNQENNFAKKNFFTEPSKHCYDHQKRFSLHSTKHANLSNHNKIGSPLGKHGTQFIQSQRQKENTRGWNNSAWKCRAQFDKTDFIKDRRFRASTPVGMSRKAVPLNTSMSTIVGFQGEEIESDTDEEEWESRLIEDVDVL